MSEAEACRRCIVTGKVQGVFFRASTQQQARRLGLRGSAVNRSDGAVEVLVCGDIDAVEQMIDWLWQGPKFASVEHVEIHGAEPDDVEFETFVTG